MEKEFDFGQEYDFGVNLPNYVELNELNEFEKKENVDSISDEEFNDLLKELGMLDEMNVSSSIFEKNDSLEKNNLSKEIELVYSKLKLEWDILEYEKSKFEREKLEWEKFKKLSEESFQAEKHEFEQHKLKEKQKMYLETRELINSCTNLNEFLEKYRSIQDVSE